ncbi:MAG: hypothetical protein ACLQM8_01400 [Limisphaerales bacterium]
MVWHLVRDIAPERGAFLAQLVPERPSTAILTLARAESLVPDVLALKERQTSDMTRPGHHYRARREDNRSFQGAYGKYGLELQNLFERTRAVFGLGKFELACDAYRELFEVLTLKDDYGFGVHRPEGLDLRAERGRYLRAVIEAAAQEAKAKMLLETARSLRERLWHAAELSLTEAFHVTPLEFEGKEAVLDDLLRLLNRDADRKSDRWLREITRLRHGVRGLEALARTDGERRPRAWIDWLEMVSAENIPAKMLAAAKDALAGIGDGLNLRAIAADHLVRAAIALRDRKAGMLGRWEAYRADPCPRRLIDLWEGAVSPFDRREWMLRAVAYGEQGGKALLPGPLVGGTGREEDAPCLEPGDGFYDAASPPTTICARLLAGDWQGALAEARKTSPGGWRCGDAGFQTVLSLLMAWFGGWPGRELSRNLADLLNQILALADEREESVPRASIRLRNAFAEAVPTWDPPKTPERQVDALGRLALREVNTLLEADNRVADDQAVLLAAALADLHYARGNRGVGRKVFDELLNRHDRKPDFKEKLNARRNLL